MPVDVSPLFADLDAADAATLLPLFDDVLKAMREEGSRMGRWADVLPDQLQDLLVTREHGDQSRWVDALRLLPSLTALDCDLNADDLAIASAACTATQAQAIEAGLRGLMPWRKGPFRVVDSHIDTEWRSDWKWQRLAPHLSDLTGRTVLDVGCGSGYHLWRMLGAGAFRVLGVDPSRLFLMQFQAIKRYVAAAQGVAPRADLLPFKMEDVPANLKAFDTVFSMGVLYHRKSPIEHLEELRGALKPGGELVLETLVIDGVQGEVLMPEDRYAMMRNVWFIPTVETLLLWCRRTGFRNARVVDLNRTSLDEQRTTDWMRYNSLVDFLDPEDISKTAEGYPAPLRAVIIAEA
ncbi:tRNA 5-methoxyuridine(34)/uridine 5-oxyacetic acid(34) synthase CmoB [Oceanobacter sp. 5_MG-2023]|uniref:tRNA 5-methoxyuridine(34)/uridine 5-oxyacetic acid(34) synthase CmoB n=2 Tax=Gammaproteobacteria TaxID=1236 RepID=UPI0026E237C1|nr:tRNA 5-methoxyuridine(34)/uridine 5-oxyacetic acid(34) synthase CmoB [Oceanobacter sp. 5_MG-2023]MDO6681763.1 tRNA 5-methoxyuridine(34)/uridine 5-oxyacetic acid(34) synthase CmoB [Oceanobacter sp. 5_MG-2023]